MTEERLAALVGEVEGLRAEVATLTTERDAAQAKADRYWAEQGAAIRDAIHLIQEKRALIADRDEARADVARLQAERDSARAMMVALVDQREAAIPLYDEYRAERDAMRPVVEHAVSLVVSLKTWGEEARVNAFAEWPGLVAAATAYVDQMAPSSPPQQPQGDDQGAVAGTHEVEAQEGAEAHPCRCGGLDPIHGDDDV